MGWFSKKNPWQGDCSACGHDWREHRSENAGVHMCSACLYEIDHQVPDAPAAPCLLDPPETSARPDDSEVGGFKHAQSGKLTLQPTQAAPLPWGAGRIGIITGNEQYSGRLALVCPYVRDRSEFVIYIAEQELTESYWNFKYLPEALNDLKIVWIESGPAEESLEREVFGIRDSFHRRK